MSFFTKEKKFTDRYGNERVERVVMAQRIVITVIVAVFLLIVLLNTFIVIPSGYTGVRTTCGQIDQQVVSPGLHFKVPFFQGIKKVNNKQQEITFDDKVWGESSERTVVYAAGITVTYRINAEYSAWIYSNVDNYKQNALPRTLVASSMKASMVSLQSSDVTNRGKIEQLVTSNLQNDLDLKYGGNRVITVVNVNIDDMDFEDSYNDAIAKKQIAQMNYEQQQIENDRAIAAANAEAEKKVISANADAQEKKIAAEAEAERERIAAKAEADAIKAVADAQAEANKKLSESLTDTLIEYEKIQQWNGKLPTVTGGSPFISMDIE